MSAPLSAFQFTPYCGAPPLPEALWRRWNLDPILLVLLISAWAAYLFAARAGAVPGWRRISFSVGWGLTTLALISPLCPLSVALFSARVGQHMALAGIAAPLVALGWRPAAAPGVSARRSPILAAVAFAIALWVWHSPGPYVETFASAPAYWLMHLTTFGAALLLWSAIFSAWGDRLEGPAIAILITVLQMGLLGAVITFAGRPLFASHLITAPTWGLSPLEDQELGGVIMWVPAGIILAAALAAGFAEALRRAEARTAPRPAA